MEYTDEYILKKEDLTAIADVIREKTSTTDTITVEQMPEKVSEVYEAGKQAEYDAFWDSFQQHGQPMSCEHLFAGAGWTRNTFKPKHNIVPNSCYMMFRNFNNVSTEEPLDLAEWLDELGVTLDFSKYTGTLNYMFQNAKISRVGVCDFSQRTAIENSFNGATELVTIDKMILKESTTQAFYDPFNNCKKLQNITIEGKINANFSIAPSTLLTKASITSIVNALSPTKTGLTVTLSLTAVNNAFEGGRDGEEWQNLIATKPNWEIAYA